MLLETALEITKYRLNSSPNKVEYVEWKVLDLQNLETLLENRRGKVNGAYGILGETMFFLVCHHFGIPISVSTGAEDLEGIDFYIQGFPLDVTTDPTSMTRKIVPERLTTIFLPRYQGQQSIISPILPTREYISHTLRDGHLPYEDYLAGILGINMELLSLMEQSVMEKNSLPDFLNPGLNNVKNLKTIMAILYMANPSLPSEALITGRPGHQLPVGV